MVTGYFLPRDLHPGAWWIWALALATAATRTSNPWVLVAIILVACAVVVARRTDAPWALSFRLYLYLGAIIVVIRVVFRILLGGGDGATIWFTLPEIPLPDWAAGIRLLGPVSQEAVLAGLYDGLRLAAMVICIGAANALANPKRLLKSMPPALYEIGTATVVALSVFPQLAESVQRVRRARRLRGDPGKGIGALRRIVVPVLEDALDRSMMLAASMDARGYGRVGAVSRERRWLTATVFVLGLIGLCVGTYAFLDHTAPRILAMPMLAVGVVLALVGFVLSGAGVHRTRYRPDRWHLAELVVVLSGVVAPVVVYVVAARDPALVIPDFGVTPVLSLSLVAGVMIGVVPAVLTPMPLAATAAFEQELADDPVA